MTDVLHDPSNSSCRCGFCAAEAMDARRREVRPIDPDSEVGRRIAHDLGELFDDIAERLRREGKPVPDCLL